MSEEITSITEKKHAVLGPLQHENNGYIFVILNTCITVVTHFEKITHFLKAIFKSV